MSIVTEMRQLGSVAAIAVVAAIASTLLAHQGLAAGRPPVLSLFEIRQEKLVMQQFDLSCGAAVVATILTHQYDDPRA